MIIRLRFGQGRAVGKHKGKNRHIALAANAVLLPIAVMFYVLGTWSLASDLELARPFTITGILSHWQVSMLIGAALHYAARRLMSYGGPAKVESDGDNLPPKGSTGGPPIDRIEMNEEKFNVAGVGKGR